MFILGSYPWGYDIGVLEQKLNSSTEVMTEEPEEAADLDLFSIKL